MRLATLTCAFLLSATAAAYAAEICGNPCEDGYVWTDANMGMCVPAAPKPPQPPEKPTS